jgi:hypothetical protein
MRTSRKYLDMNYIKILPDTPEISNTKKETELNSYQKQLMRSRDYYQNNKDKVLNKQKEYKNSIPKEEKAKAKIIYFLNNDENYKNKVKPQTVEKYNIKCINGIWV